MIIAGTESFFLPGDGKKEVVLLLQGFARNTAELLLLGNFLQAQGYTVLAPRLPGHGTTAEDMLRTNAEDWLDAVRDAYAVLKGFAQDIVVVGASMGGSLALLLAAEKQVKGIVAFTCFHCSGTRHFGSSTQGNANAFRFYARNGTQS